MPGPLLPMTGTQAEAPAAAPEAKAKKSKKKLIIIAVVVLLLAGVGAKETVLKSKPKVVLGKDGKPVKVVTKVVGGDDITLEPVTTSISDGHVIQIALGLQLVKGADAKAITAEAPKVNDAALQVLAQYTYKTLLSPKGRAKVRVEIKNAVIKSVVGDKDKQQIFDVFLPTYVLQ
jgi:flagellar basal body-associated protein FliL